MTDTSKIPSVTDRAKPVAAGAPVVGIHFLGDRAVFVLGEETLLFVSAQGAEQRVAIHSGGILSVACDGARVLTGGDDGKVVATSAKGENETLATDAKHRWIDRVALGPDGAVAWSAGKQAYVRTGKSAINCSGVAHICDVEFGPLG